MVALKTSEVKHRRAEEALQQERRALTQLLELQERERRLIAYEIHDGLAQQLTGALLQFQAFRYQWERNPGEASKSFDAVLRLLADSRAAIDSAPHRGTRVVVELPLPSGASF